MRSKERINIFFKYCDTKEKIKKYLIWLDIFGNEEDKMSHQYPDITGFHIRASENIFNLREEIKKVWKEGWNYDLRLTQLLVSQGFLPNYKGFWFYKEEQQFLLEVLKIAPEKVLLWGQNYDKNMKRLKKTKYRPIEEMNSGHIKAILHHIEKKEMKVDPLYEIYFHKVLKDRGEL